MARILFLLLIQREKPLLKLNWPYQLQSDATLSVFVLTDRVTVVSTGVTCLQPWNQLDFTNIVLTG